MRQLPGVNQHFPVGFLLTVGVAGFAATLAAMYGFAFAPRGDTPSAGTPSPHDRPVAEEGQLEARPPVVAKPGGTTRPGLHKLEIARGRDGLIYVPAGYRADRPTPVVVMLHGAGGNAQHGVSLLQPLADANNLLILAPESRVGTWDVIGSDYGPDVAFIDAALAQTFRLYSVDPARLAVGGFSDGASYALSIGITNGDLFTHIVAFSPGFMVPTRQEGKPRIYISHGTHDAVLPIGACSRRIVPQLQRAGYDVTYREFDGPHSVPPPVKHEAVSWLAGTAK